jgi:Transposase IS4
MTKLTYSTQEFGAGGATVLTMMKDYLGEGKKLIVDNFFNSPKLATFLLGKNTRILGTVRKNRKNMPKCRKLDKGEAEFYTSGDIVVEHWLDRRDVYMLNTFLPHEMKDSFSTNPKNTTQKPQSVLLYNSMMGAVDLVDQVTKPFVTERRSLKWYKKVAFHMIDVSVYNSLQVFNNPREKKEKKTFKEFVLLIVEEIFDQNPTERATKGRKRTFIDSSAQMRLTGVHLPQKAMKESGKPKNVRCFYCSLKGERHETPYMCKTCNQHLCIQANRDCFAEYHTVHTIPQKKRHLKESSNN